MLMVSQNPRLSKKRVSISRCWFIQQRQLYSISGWPTSSESGPRPLPPGLSTTKPLSRSLPSCYVNRLLLTIAIYSESFPSYKMVIFHSYVSLPEGKCTAISGYDRFFLLRILQETCQSWIILHHFKSRYIILPRNNQPFNDYWSWGRKTSPCWCLMYFTSDVDVTFLFPTWMILEMSKK